MSSRASPDRYSGLPLPCPAIIHTNTHTRAGGRARARITHSLTHAHFIHNVTKARPFTIIRGNALLLLLHLLLSFGSTEINRRYHAGERTRHTPPPHTKHPLGHRRRIFVSTCKFHAVQPRTRRDHPCTAATAARSCSCRRSCCSLVAPAVHDGGPARQQHPPRRYFSDDNKHREKYK